MLERGVVIKNDESGIDIRMQPSAFCEKCNACFMDKSNFQILHLKQNLKVKAGDAVEIEVKPAFAVQSAFLIFFLPLLMFIIGYYLFNYLVNIPALSEVYQGIIGAFAALIITYVGVHYYDKHLSKTDPGKRVYIVRVIN